MPAFEFADNEYKYVNIQNRLLLEDISSVMIFIFLL